MPSTEQRDIATLKKLQRRSQSSFSVLSLFVNPTSLIAVLVFIFAVMLWFTVCFFGLWNTGVGNLAGTWGVAETNVAQRGAEAENAKKDRYVRELRNTVEKHDAEGRTRNQIQKNTNAHLRDAHKLNEEEAALHEKMHNADYNTGSVIEAEKIGSSSYLQLTPDTYQVRTCEKSEYKKGIFTWCLSGKRTHEPRPLKSCGFECVPYLPKLEFDAAVDIFQAKDRKAAFETNDEGVIAWFEYFNVLGHTIAKEKFAQIFRVSLESMCASAAKNVELVQLESVKNVCGPFYPSPTPRLSSNAHNVHRLVEIASGEF